MGILLRWDLKLFKIEDVRKSSELNRSKNVRRTGDGDNFASYLNSGSISDNKNIPATSSITSADAIFAAQMVNDEEEREIRKKLIKKGKNLIEMLEEIRDSLLFGEISKDRLIEISRMVKKKDFSSTDDVLNNIIEEIELRVEVELAKIMK